MGRPVVHFEIGCKDNKKAQEFYSKLFGWDITEQGPAMMVNTGSTEGIQGHISALGHEPHNYVNIYVDVDDVDAYLKKVEEAGGKTVIPTTEVPGMGWFAWFSDVEGTTIGLWKSMPQE
jgi:predicted enzyme related to lactoylglutathione lyase